MNNNQKYIGVYTDTGADFGMLRASINQYASSVDLSVKNIHAEDINQGKLDPESIVAFFLPGATDGTQYREKLYSKIIKENIHNYVENGGVFAGECAGAYYTCAQIKYKLDHPDKSKRKDKTGLGLMNTHAIGHLPELLHADEDRLGGGYQTAVTRVTYNKKTAEILYWGGPKIDNIENDPDIETIASYTDLPNQPIAIAKKKIGKGFAIFSGPHFCIDGHQMKERAKFHPQTRAFGETVANMLIEAEESRLELFNHMMTEILTPHFSREKAKALSLKS